ncbi:hypothetical protein [Microvirga sp. 2TAF3]|uniref:hypothetical protein n=1 Tax=Microvirga sp. 2TAF3 TaxID=3233014 RepID=UPI003F99711A
MTLAKVGLAAALAAFVGVSVNAANAAPFLAGSVSQRQAEIVQVQYHDRGRHLRPTRKVCKTEVVRRWVNGRPIKEHVQRCFTRR